MLTRSLSNNIHNQVKSVVEDLVNKVVNKRKKVTWASNGITAARTFVIEPWRRIRSTPPTRVRSADKGTYDEPFILPDAPMMKPLADYSDYKPPEPTPPKAMTDRPQKVRPRKTMTLARVEPITKIVMECVLTDDDDDDKKPGSSAAALLPRTQPASLAEVYAIVESMKKIKDLDAFINGSEPRYDLTRVNL